MVQKYDILGRKIGSHHLAIGVLSTMFAGVYYAMSGAPKAASTGPAINASSKEEENFISDFLKEAEGKSGAKA